MEIPQIPLEDAYADIISKAQAGLGLADSDMIKLTGLDRQSIRAARRGSFVESDALKLAETLKLDHKKLCDSARKSWYPKSSIIDEIIPVTMPFPESGYDEMTVNAYILQIPGTDEAILFDAGTRPQMIIKELMDHQLKLSCLFLTHGHRDHVGGMNTIQEAFPSVYTYAHFDEKIKGAYTLSDHQLFAFGNNIEVTCIRTPGHSKGGISYFINGLENPVVITGDALFAGSIGGVINNYQEALKDISERLFTLPEDTIVCPGHGPMSIIGEEKEHNPFFILQS